MRIQHNIMAMSAYRNYTNNVSAMKKNLEKLSSGYKINRAGDDAAGLAISEKMRAQITGLETAQKNAKDGISLVQTAEGALTEVHDMLNRMVELATQSANGTYDNTTDRAQMQKEIDQLKSEINRIADSSNFNGIKLLNGDMTAATSNTTYDYTFSGQTDLMILAGNATDVATAAGTSTVIHKDSEGSNLTSFEVDLRNTSLAVTATSGRVTLNVGGATLSFTATSADKDTTLNGKVIADRLADGVSANGVKINGVSYNVSVAADGVLKFEMDAKSAASITDAASFSANVGNPNSITASGGNLKSDDVDDLIQNYKMGNMDDGTVYASTETNTAFFSAANLGPAKDGSGIKIGDTSYVFAFTKETLAKDYGNDGSVKVVDLTDCLNATGTAFDTTKVELAASRFSQAAADNEMFRVGVNKGGFISFRERMDYSGDADLTTKAGIQAQIQKFDSVAAAGTTTTGGGSGALTLQIGDTADDFNQLKVEIQDCHVDAMGIGDISIADQDSAAKAVDAIKAAINYVSDVRGTLGATQNRLDHTINNLSVMTENIQDAESTIRDVDVAEEMMAYTKNNILIQSAQAMLAQANQVPQGVLQLLQ